MMGFRKYIVTLILSVFSLAAYSQQLYNRYGEIIGRYESEKIYDRTGFYKGRQLADRFYDAKGNYIGLYSNGRYYDKQGGYIGYFKDSKFYSGSGGGIWVKSKGSRSTTDSGIFWGGFVVLLNPLLVQYISTYCCPVNFKTVEKSGSSERLEGCGNYREPFFSEFGLASRSWIPPPAPTSAPSALTSTPNARVLHARPAFFVFCLHLFTTRP